MGSKDDAVDALRYIVDQFGDPSSYKNISIELDSIDNMWVCTITLEDISDVRNARYFDAVVVGEDVPDIYQIYSRSADFEESVDQTRKRLMAIRDAVEGDE